MTFYAAAVGALLTFGSPGTPVPQDLQAKVDSCLLGATDKDGLVALFGPPEEMKKGVTWHAASGKRQMYEARYPSLGLTFTLLAGPWELYNIEIENPALTVLGVHPGDALDEVVRRHGEGQWLSSRGAPTHRLQYEAKGAYFEFKRDPKVPQWPMKLLEPAVVTRVVLYNARYRFR